MSKMSILYWRRIKICFSILQLNTLLLDFPQIMLENVKDLRMHWQRQAGKEFKWEDGNRLRSWT
ncbi:hypothetical protein ACFQ9Y_13425 [Peribacillus simplex]|uniref:hypothetical protein n=1 Tax=Peribacillus simplex TaxID=1478 RepID=UPI00366E9747